MQRIGPTCTVSNEYDQIMAGQSVQMDHIPQRQTGQRDKHLRHTKISSGQRPQE